MKAVADEAIKEVAATREKRPNYRLASQEFFYLVERIDRLDEKLTNKIESLNKSLDTKLTDEIKSLDTKLTGKIESLDTKFNTIQQWMIGVLVALIVGFGGIIAVLMRH